MLEDSDRLLETIEQILRTGRIGHSSRKPNLSRIDLGGLVEAPVIRARMLHNLSTDSLQYQAGAPLTILADLDEVRAAVSNLVDNAVKYSGSNVNVLVEIDATDQKYVSVRVRDQGAGIPKTELKPIFKRFYRARGPASPRVAGTGLGLYIVRSVAKRHGGRAWAESEGPGRGSTFVLQLPVAR
jgi:signal transduction histidine kinase